jgi:hypothetical protein
MNEHATGVVTCPQHSVRGSNNCIVAAVAAFPRLQNNNISHASVFEMVGGRSTGNAATNNDNFASEGDVFVTEGERRPGHARETPMKAMKPATFKDERKQSSDESIAKLRTTNRCKEWRMCCAESSTDTARGLVRACRCFLCVDECGVEQATAGRQRPQAWGIRAKRHIQRKWRNKPDSTTTDPKGGKCTRRYTDTPDTALFIVYMHQ